jgi:hypothetical protein
MRHSVEPITMMPIKAIGVAALLTVSALSLAQDKVKIEAKWTKDVTYKLKNKAAFEVGGHNATIDTKLKWSSEMGKDGYTVTVHHDEITVVADENEVPVPVEDYKISFDSKSVMTGCEGGLQGTDTLRMFLITNFYAPTAELSKDAATKWEIAKNEKTGLGGMKVETTYLGDEKIGKETLHKFKQVASETGTEYSTTGTFYVTKNGQVLKADVKFKGVPITAAGGDAAGSWTVTPIE